MLNKTRAALAALLLASGAAQAAALIDFEDFVDPGCCAFPAPGYQGFTWSGGSGDTSWVVGTKSANVFGGTQTVSGDNYAWSNGATSLALSAAAGGSFDLYSFWARGAGEYDITARGYRDGVEVFTTTFSVNEIYAKVTLDFTGIDHFGIDSQLSNLLIDDISVSAVPEPASVALLVTGLGFIGWRARSSALR